VRKSLPAVELAAEDAATDPGDASTHGVEHVDCTRKVARQPRRFHEHHKWAHLAEEIRAK
jgi:hypothetical protein